MAPKRNKPGGKANRPPRPPKHTTTTGSDDDSSSSGGHASSASTQPDAERGLSPEDAVATAAADNASLTENPTLARKSSATNSRRASFSASGVDQQTASAAAAAAPMSAMAAAANAEPSLQSGLAALFGSESTHDDDDGDAVSASSSSSSDKEIELPDDWADVLQKSRQQRRADARADGSPTHSAHAFEDDEMTASSSHVTGTTAARSGRSGGEARPIDIDLTTCDDLADVTAIGEGFAKGFALRSVNLPTTVRRIAAGFLEGASTDVMKGMRVLDLSLLDDLRFIGDRFLQRCDVEKLALPPKPQLVSIGTGFLAMTTRLSVVDLGSALGIKRIPEDFCSGAAAVTKVSLPPDIIEIGDSFCRGAKKLKELRMARCVKLISIGSSFLADSGLGAISLPPGVVTIGRGFAYGARELASIDCERCESLVTIPGSFAAESAVKSVKLPPGLQSIGDRFFASAFEIEAFDFNTQCASRVLGTIGSDAFANCPRLQSILLSPSIRQIGVAFANATVALDTLDMSLARSLKRLPAAVLENSGVTEIIFPATVEAIAHRFAHKATRLETLEMNSLKQLRAIGDEFCTKAALLTLVVLPPSVARLGARFCFLCPALKRINGEGCRGIRLIGSHFAALSTVQRIELRMAPPHSAAGSNPSLVAATLAGNASSVNNSSFAARNASMAVAAATATKDHPEGASEALFSTGAPGGGSGGGGGTAPTASKLRQHQAVAIATGGQTTGGVASTGPAAAGGIRAALDPFGIFDDPIDELPPPGAFIAESFALEAKQLREVRLEVVPPPQTGGDRDSGLPSTTVVTAGGGGASQPSKSGFSDRRALKPFSLCSIGPNFCRQSGLQRLLPMADPKVSGAGATTTAGRNAIAAGNQSGAAFGRSWRNNSGGGGGRGRGGIGGGWRSENYTADITMPAGIGPSIGASFMLGATRAKSVSFKECGRSLKSIRRDCLRDCSADLTRVMLPHFKSLKVGRHFCERSARDLDGGGGGAGDGGERKLLITGFSQRTLEGHVKDVLYSSDAVAALDQFVRILPHDDVNRVALFLLSDKRDVPLFLRLFDRDDFSQVSDVVGGTLAKDGDLTLLHWAIACFPHRLAALHPNIEMLRQRTALGYNALHYAAVHGINQTAVGHLLAHASVQSIRDLEADSALPIDADDEDESDEYDADGFRRDGSDEYAPSGDGSRTITTLSMASNAIDGGSDGDDDDDDESDARRNGSTSDEDTRRFRVGTATARAAGIHAKGGGRLSRQSSVRSMPNPMPRRGSTASSAVEKPPPPAFFAGEHRQARQQQKQQDASDVPALGVSAGAVSAPPFGGVADDAGDEDGGGAAKASSPVTSAAFPPPPAAHAEADALFLQTRVARSDLVLPVTAGDPNGPGDDDGDGDPNGDEDDDLDDDGGGSSRHQRRKSSEGGLSGRQATSLLASPILPLGAAAGGAGRLELRPRPPSTTPLHLALSYRHYETVRALLIKSGYEANPTKRATPAASVELLRISGFPVGGRRRHRRNGAASDDNSDATHEVEFAAGENDDDIVADDGCIEHGGREPSHPTALTVTDSTSSAATPSAEKTPLRRLAMPLDAYDLTLIHWSAAAKVGGPKGAVIAGECRKIIAAMEDPKSAHIGEVKARFEHRFHLAYVWPSFTYFIAFLLWLIFTTIVFQPKYSTMVESAIEIEVKNCLPRYSDHFAAWAHYAGTDDGDWCVSPNAHGPRLLEIVLEQRRVLRHGGNRDKRPGYISVTYRPIEIRTLSMEAIQATLDSGANLFLHSLRMVTDVGYAGPDTYLDAAEELGGDATVALASPSRNEYRVFTEYVVQRPLQFRFSTTPAAATTYNATNATVTAAPDNLPPVQEQRVFLKPITKAQFGHYVIPSQEPLWRHSGIASAVVTVVCWLAAVVDLWLAFTTLSERLLKRASRVLVRPTAGSIAAASLVSVLQAAVCVQMTVLSSRMIAVSDTILSPTPTWIHADQISALRSSASFLSVLLAVPALRFARHTPSFDTCVTVTVVAGALVAAGVWFVLSFYVPAHRVEAVAENVGVSTPSPLNLSGGSVTTILFVIGAFWVPVMLLRAHGLPTDTARQWWSDTLNTCVDRLCRAQRHTGQRRPGGGGSGPLRRRARIGLKLQLLKEFIYSKTLRRVTVFTACLLLSAMYVVCAFVFLSPYLVDSPFGADPAKTAGGGGTSGSSGLASQAGAAAAVFGGGF